jgi:hypothetical protein
MHTESTFNKTTHNLKRQPKEGILKYELMLSQLTKQYKKIQRILTLLKVTAI